MKARRTGFTLIELMIVIVIVAVLAMIALPSYNDHLRKGRRAAAQAHLLDIAQRQQQYFHDVRSYTSTVATLTATPADVADYYTIAIAIAAGPPPTFTATATPKAGTAQATDLGGAALSISSAGAKLPAGAW